MGLPVDAVAACPLKVERSPTTQKAFLNYRPARGSMLLMHPEMQFGRMMFSAFCQRATFHTALYEDFRVKCYCNSMSFIVRGSV